MKATGLVVCLWLMSSVSWAFQAAGDRQWVKLLDPDVNPGEGVQISWTPWASGLTDAGDQWVVGLVSTRGFVSNALIKNGSFVAKLDPMGQVLLFQHFPAAWFYSLQVTAQGGCVLAGVTEQGPTLVHLTPEGRVTAEKVQAHPDEGWVLIASAGDGSTFLLGCNDDLTHVTKRTSDGSVAFSVHLTQNDEDIKTIFCPPVIAPTFDGGCAVAISTWLMSDQQTEEGQGSLRVTLVRLDAGGNIQWQTQLSRLGYWNVVTKMVELKGNIVAVGRTEGPQQNAEILSVVLDSQTGTRVRSCVSERSGEQEALDVIVRDGKALIASVDVQQGVRRIALMEFDPLAARRPGARWTGRTYDLQASFPHLSLGKDGGISLSAIRDLSAYNPRPLAVSLPPDLDLGSLDTPVSMAMPEVILTVTPSNFGSSHSSTLFAPMTVQSQGLSIRVTTIQE